MWDFVASRLREPSSWSALAKALGAVGTFIAGGGYAGTANTGYLVAGAIIGAIGVFCGSVGEFVTKEGPRPSP